MIRLRFERVSRKLSQTAVGAAAGLPQHIVSFIEIGRIRPTDEELRRLGAVFGVAPDALLKEVIVGGER